MTAVVLQTAFLGDMILTMPLVARLAERGPVDVVATPASAPLLENHPAVRRVIVWDKRGADRGFSGMRRLAADIRGSRADVAYLAQGSLRTASVALLAGVRRRVGFDSSPGRVLYTERVHFDPALHHAARLWSLASRPGDGMQPVPRPSLHPGAHDQAAVRDLLNGAGVDDAAALLVLAPGSVWATKRWPGYDALAAQLSVHARFASARIVVIGGASDRVHADGIGAALTAAGSAPVIDATGRLSLLASAALIGRASLLVTNDSAPLHLASAMNTPTIAVFGPTVPAFGFGPLAEANDTLGHTGLPCRPCDAHGPQQCPLGHWRCMRELPPERVVQAAETLVPGYFPG